MNKKYRITHESFNGKGFYIVQIKYWFFPFWIQYSRNGFVTYRIANDFLNKIYKTK
jgi:hypothetical protein